MTHIEVMKQALEVVEQGSVDHLSHLQREKLITALRTAIEQESGSYLPHLFGLANNMANNAEVLIGALQPYAPLQVVHKSIVQQVAWLQESVDRYHDFAQAVHDAHGSKLEKEA